MILTRYRFIGPKTIRQLWYDTTEKILGFLGLSKHDFNFLPHQKQAALYFLIFLITALCLHG